MGPRFPPIPDTQDPGAFGVLGCQGRWGGEEGGHLREPPSAESLARKHLLLKIPGLPRAPPWVRVKHGTETSTTRSKHGDPQGHPFPSGLLHFMSFPEGSSSVQSPLSRVSLGSRKSSPGVLERGPHPLQTRGIPFNSQDPMENHWKSPRNKRAPPPPSKKVSLRNPGALSKMVHTLVTSSTCASWRNVRK